jgi:hypothetical protein
MRAEYRFHSDFLPGIFLSLELIYSTKKTGEGRPYDHPPRTSIAISSGKTQLMRESP